MNGTLNKGSLVKGGSTGGGGSVATLNYFDGNTGPTLDTHLTLGNAVMVYKNGVLLEAGADYTISGSVITFVTALEETDKISVLNGNVNAINVDEYVQKFKMYDYIQDVTIADDTATVELEEDKNVYKVTPSADFDLEIDVSQLNINSNMMVTFYLLVDTSSANDACEISNADDFKWGNTSPTMTAMVHYLFAFSSFDGGQTWVANQMYSWE